MQVDNDGTSILVVTTQRVCGWCKQTSSQNCVHSRATNDELGLQLLGT
jgi:hypothetical protein